MTDRMLMRMGEGGGKLVDVVPTKLVVVLMSASGRHHKSSVEVVGVDIR